jgi:hypothetical protein
MPMREHESILIFGLGKVNFYPQMEQKEKENIRPVGRRGLSDCYGSFKEKTERLIPLDMTFPRSVIKINNTILPLNNF